MDVRYVFSSYYLVPFMLTLFIVWWRLINHGGNIFFNLNTNDGNSDVWDFVHSVKVDNVMKHLSELNRIAYNHPSRSRSVLNAYNQSADFVWRTLRGHTDCQLSKQYFKVPVWSLEGDQKLESTAPYSVQYQYGVDFMVMRYGGAGKQNLKSLSVTQIGALNSLDFGCNEKSWSNFSGGVALIEADYSAMRNSGCSVYEASLKAQAYGASAVMFSNPEDRKNLYNGRVRSVEWKDGDALVNIPVLSVSHSFGAFMAKSSSEMKLNLDINAKMTIATTLNIICDTDSGDSNNVVMFGAHLDSVPAGPGLVDNGSGSSSLLEVALQFFKNGYHKTAKNRVRFAWWGAEELGLMGSRHYARELEKTPVEKEKLVVYSNFDMLASPNYIPYVYQGSTAPTDIQSKSTQLQQIFEKFFKNIPAKKKPPHFRGNYELRPMSGGSDFYSFLEINVPSGGLATGAGELKTIEDRHRFGGMAKTQLDPCYHQACDTIENISQDVLNIMAKALAYCTHHLTMKENVRESLI